MIALNPNKKRYEPLETTQQNEILGRHLLVIFLDGKHKNYLLQFTTNRYAMYDASLFIDNKYWTVEIKCIYGKFNQFAIDVKKVEKLYNDNHNVMIFAFYPNENKIRYIHVATILNKCVKNYNQCKKTTTGSDNSIIPKENYMVPYSYMKEQDFDFTDIMENIDDIKEFTTVYRTFD